MQIPAGEFKSKCLKLMDQVKETHEEIVVTKYGGCAGGSARAALLSGHRPTRLCRHLAVEYPAGWLLRADPGAPAVPDLAGLSPFDYFT